MVQRWYRAYQTHGTPDGYLNRVFNAVTEYDLHDFIPEVRFERQTKQRGVREFYLFLGINSEEFGQLPETIIPYLELLDLGHYRGDVLYNEIAPMVSGAVEMRNYARSIPYEAPERSQFNDPFEVSSIEIEPSDSLIAESLNKLLFWLSAIGTGTWNTFVKAYQALELADAGLDPRHIARRFRLLGHLEYLDGGRKWSVCPPCLVISAINDELAFLAGQRTPRLIDALAKIIEVNVEPQKNGDGPDVILLKLGADSNVQTRLAEIAEASQCNLLNAGIASQKLATVVNDLDGYRQSLSVVPVIPSRFTIHKWAKGQFQETSFDRTSGMYRLVPRGDDQDAQQFTVYYDESSQAWRQGDWYGMRYLASLDSETACNVHLQKGTLAIPVNLRWPDYYERSLVLASGRLPRQDGDWLYFEGVSSVVANTLSKKLFAQLKGEA